MIGGLKRFSPKLMGIKATVGGLFGSRSGEADEGGGIVYDVDREGRQLYKEDIIKNVLEDLEKRRTEKLGLEQQWRLNANFLIGNQYCAINTYRGDIEQLEPVYDWLERETFNQIAPLIETRIANLKKINYRMKVNPRTNELEDYAKAETSTTLLQYLQTSTDFDTKKNTAIAWNELCGNCFYLSWWDEHKGDKYAVDYKIAIGEDGIEHKEVETYYQGDLDYGLITPYEVFPESIFKQGVEAQRSIILEQVKTVDDIHDLYGLTVEGADIATFELTPTVSGGGFGYENSFMSLGTRTAKNSAKVVTYFERPSRHKPNGLLIIIVGDDELVYYGDLPYKRIPLVQMICREMPGQFFGKSVIEDLIPRQRAYNGCLNRIHEYIKRVVIQSHYIEEGSLIDIEEYEEEGCAPGACIVYRKNSQPPVPVPNGQLPSELMAERHNLKSDMEYVAGTSQLMVNGALPSGVHSGTAIENLMSIDNTRLSLTGDYVRNSIKNLAIMWLEIYKRYATTKRIINYVGKNNIGSAMVWSGEDINSYDIDYVTENELMQSEEVQKQTLFDAYNKGLFTDSEGRVPDRVKLRMIEAMKVGRYSEILSLNLLQMQAAQRENVWFDNGIVPEVTEFDDHSVHIDEHLRYMYQMDFQVLKMRKPDYAKAFEDHVRNHKQAQQETANANMMQALAQQIQQ